MSDGNVFKIVPGSIALNARGNGVLTFGTASVERVRVDKSGNVGIGTYAPAYKLDISGQTRIYEATGTGTVSGTANTLVSILAGRTTGSLTLRHGNAPGQSSIVFPSAVNYTSNYGDYGYITWLDDIYNEVGQERGRLLIGTENDYTHQTYIDAVVLQAFGGYVGIGQIGPAYTLDVSGTARATAFIGPLTGNVTGTVSGSSGSCTGNAATATTAGGLTGTPNITVGTITSGAITTSGTLNMCNNSIGNVGTVTHGNGNTTTRMFGSYYSPSPYNSDFFITNNLATFTSNSTDIVTATYDSTAYGPSAIRLKSDQAGGGGISFYAGAKNTLPVNVMTIASDSVDVSGTARAQKFLGSLTNAISGVAPVSPFAAQNGGDGLPTDPKKTQIEFQHSTGGYNHYIGTRHYGNAVGSVCNAIDFWLYSGTSGTGSTVSSAPGTGNVNMMSITAGGVGIGTPTPATTLDISGGLTVRNGIRPLYSKIVSGTSITPAASSYGTHYDINTSAITGLTISYPAAGSNNWSNDSNAYWVFRNNTGAYLSLAITYTTAVPNIYPSNMIIPPGNAVTLMATYPGGGTNSNYVLF